MRKKFHRKNLIVFAQLELARDLYGNPKVHKTVVNNTPKFLTILSVINTPTYLLAEYLNPILSPLTTNEITVKIFFNFAREVVNCGHNLYIASLDVETLFTNIPLKETIKICVNDLFSKIILIIVN